MIQCPVCSATIKPGPSTMVRHAMNRPDHKELFDAAQSTLDRKRKLADLKRELAAEKASRKKALRTEPGNSAASALLLDSDSAPSTDVAGAGNKHHAAAGSDLQQHAAAVRPGSAGPSSRTSDDNHIKFQIKSIPGLEFKITAEPQETSTPN